MITELFFGGELVPTIEFLGVSQNKESHTHLYYIKSYTTEQRKIVILGE